MTTQPLVKALKARRKAQKLSRKQVARSADISPTTVNRLETGANVGLEAACAIATVLGGELRFAPTDTVPVPTEVPAQPGEVSAASPPPTFELIRLFADDRHEAVYRELRSRFEIGERFTEVLYALNVGGLSWEEIGAALILLAQSDGLPSSRDIRRLCAAGNLG